MKHIVVTGGNGRVGSWVIEDLKQHGYDVTSIDNSTALNKSCRTLNVNLNHYNEVYDALAGADAVVHMAAIPAPGIQSNEITFANNTVSAYNLLEAAANRGITKVVSGSSESIYGFAYAAKFFSPLYIPIDEEHPIWTQECYGLSKQVNEQTAEMFNRRLGMQIVSLRFACILTPDLYHEYQILNQDLQFMKKTLWSYIDIRDAATACRLGLQAEGLGAVSLNIAADDTIADAATSDMLQKFYPDTNDIRGVLDKNTAVFSNSKAKKLLNWKPEYSWKNAKLSL